MTESPLPPPIALRDRAIVLVHGDLPAVEWFEATLAADLPGSRIIRPQPGATIDL